MAVSSDLKIDFTDDSYSLAHWGGLQLQLYWKPVTLFHMQRLEAITEAYLKSCSRGYAVLSVIQSSVGIPSAEVREAASRLIARFANERRSMAAVLEYSGPMAQLLVTIVRGFNRIGSGKKHVQIFGSLPEAAAHMGSVLTEIMERPVTSSEVLSVVERARHLTRPSPKEIAKATDRAAL